MKRCDHSVYGDRFADRKPRILLGIVAFGDVAAEILHSWTVWCMRTGALYHEDFQVFIGIATRMEQYRARNFLVREAIQHEADFLLMIDDDEFIHEAPDMLKSFYELGKPFQTALCCQRGDGFEGRKPTVLREVSPGVLDWYKLHEIPEVPSPVEFSGGGCTWMDMEKAKRLIGYHWWPYPSQEVMFLPNPALGLDLHFCHRVRHELGEEIWLNTNVVLGHLRKQREVVRFESECDAWLQAHGVPADSPSLPATEEPK